MKASDDIPVWKKDLVARLRAQNKCTGNQAVTVCSSQQSGSPLSHSESTGRAPKHQTSVGIRPTTCNQLSAAPRARSSVNSVKNDNSVEFISPLTLRKKSKMVQERLWSGEYNSWESGNNSRTSDSDSSEELHYGPGIVSKLKNKYLSLTLHRENQKANLRKAASLEDLLDGEDDEPKNDVELRRPFETKKDSNRYRNRSRGVQDMKRARSMEAISRFERMISPPPVAKLENGRPKSMHEYLLIADLEEGSDKRRKPEDNTENETNGVISSNYVARVNRPKRIAPVMNEREKPPADVVKQAKMIFEKRPEQRTKPPVSTGEVAAKVASYKSIIVQSKQTKNKPPVKAKPVVAKNGDAKNENSVKKPETKPNKPKKVTNGTKTDAPKVIPRTRLSPKKTQTPKPEKTLEKLETNDVKPPALIPDVSIVKTEETSSRLCHTPDLIMTLSPIAVSTPSDLNRSPSPPTDKIPIDEPLELIINSAPSVVDAPKTIQISPIPRRKIVSPPIRPQKDTVLEKNLINAAKSLEKDKVDVFVPKKVKRPPREPESNSIVFKFTDRKDVPDYVQNDRSRSAGRLERPKVGEGGIILLPGAAIDESFTDEDEEIRKYLEAPPSPCDVTFINDNILIDGKSSIKQKEKRNRMRISFVESGPDVFEYPSESSLLIDESPTSVPSSSTPVTGNTVPNLSGSYLANYIPKSTEEFQPGVSRTVSAVATPPVEKEEKEEEDQPLMEEIDQPVTFSAGTNSDMLF